MIEVYHTSNQRVDLPDTRHSRKALDFGAGFYFTTLREQAERYAYRFAKRGEGAWLNIYDFSEDWVGWRVKTFESYDEEWLDFVVSCRAGKQIGDYDMVVGGVANDKIFDTMSLFFEGLIPKAEALRRLVYEKPNIQYCVRAEMMIRQCLTFKQCIKL
ncbi:MAG: DUF3990 domain-containing protein [Prevotellaceae bacterium]|nr:DUF3990 domain-containing protein [Prevotellaceae bacterium]